MTLKYISGLVFKRYLGITEIHVLICVCSSYVKATYKVTMISEVFKILIVIRKDSKTVLWW